MVETKTIEYERLHNFLTLHYNLTLKLAYERSVNVEVEKHGEKPCLSKKVGFHPCLIHSLSKSRQVDLNESSDLVTNVVHGLCCLIQEHSRQLFIRKQF